MKLTFVNLVLKMFEEIEESAKMETKLNGNNVGSIWKASVYGELITRLRFISVGPAAEEYQRL